MAKKSDKTTVGISLDVWYKMNGLRRNPQETPNDIFKEAIVLLEKQRRLENDI